MVQVHISTSSLSDLLCTMTAGDYRTILYGHLTFTYHCFSVMNELHSALLAIRSFNLIHNQWLLTAARTAFTPTQIDWKPVQEWLQNGVSMETCWINWDLLTTLGWTDPVQLYSKCKWLFNQAVSKGARGHVKHASRCRMVYGFVWINKGGTVPCQCLVCWGNSCSSGTTRRRGMIAVTLSIQNTLDMFPLTFTSILTT